MSSVGPLKITPVQLSHLCVENLPVILIWELIMVIYCSHSQRLPNVLAQLGETLPISHSLPIFVSLFILFLLENIHKILHLNADISMVKTIHS